MTCNECIHIAVCYRRVGMTSDSYANKCGDFEPSKHKGHWIKGINIYFNTEAYRCSECNYHTVYKNDICPNCKAEMESEE